jgi:2-C-methyl-D-erythritol 4-phosphate cytidylyltransferase
MAAAAGPPRDRLVDRCVQPASGVTDIVVVASPELGEPGTGQRFVRAEPGASRTQSVLSGLAALDVPEDARVLIHDAARPGIDAALITALIEALDIADAAAPALPVSDALKRDDEGALTTVDRAGLYRIQTPRPSASAPSARPSKSGADLVDDLAAVEAAGARVQLIAGSAKLSKITYPEDFDMLARLLAPTGAPRVGKGFDVHEFEAGDHVTLCGVAIPHSAKLKGHSDADAGWHALTDAILGAVALGDIGDHFPPSDPRWKNADSGIFLKHAQTLAEAKGLPDRQLRHHGDLRSAQGETPPRGHARPHRRTPRPAARRRQREGHHHRRPRLHRPPRRHRRRGDCGADADALTPGLRNKIRPLRNKIRRRIKRLKDFSEKRAPHPSGRGYTPPHPRTRRSDRGQRPKSDTPESQR